MSLKHAKAGVEREETIQLRGNFLLFYAFDVGDEISLKNIKFSKKGEHFDYFESFFGETFYNQKDTKVKSSIGFFFTDLFNNEKSFTKSDLDMITTIYKLLDKYLKH